MSQLPPPRSQEAEVVPEVSSWGVSSQPRADSGRSLFSSQQAPGVSSRARDRADEEPCGADLTFLAEDLCSDQFPRSFGLKCILLFSFSFFSYLLFFLKSWTYFFLFLSER